MSSKSGPARILFTIPNFITAGSGQALLHVVKRLDRALFNPGICVLKLGGKLESEIQAHNIPLLELPFAVRPRPLHTLPSSLWRASRHFAPYGFDIWHSYHYSSDYTEPIIARLSGARAWVFTKKNMGWGSRAWKIRSLLATRIAAQNSTMLSTFFSSDWIAHKTRFIPRGVDTERFRPDEQPRLKLRETLNLSSDVVLVGCVAHLLPVKGHPTLLRAFAEAPSAHLLLAGNSLDEHYVKQLNAIVNELGIADRVHFLGNVSDVPALHAELDLFVLPTLGRMRMEGCPVALLEAMACGLACIATDVPGSRDIIQHGQNGMLVPPEEETALSRAILELTACTDRRLTLGVAARKRILDQYNIDREVQQHEALYAEILGL